MRKAAGILAFAWFAIVFASVFILFYPLFLVFLSHEKLYPAANFLRKVWAWISVLLTGSFPRIDKPAQAFPETCVIVSNHTSYLDIVVLGLIAPLKISFIGKKQLAEIPLFGIFFRTVDVAVNRESIRDSYKALSISRQKLDKGYSVNIYPEGTIWDKTPELKAFKNGAFKLAIEAGVPVVPVTFYNNYLVLPDDKFEYYPSVIRCKVHRPISTAHLKTGDEDALRDEIYNLIRNDLVKAHILP